MYKKTLRQRTRVHFQFLNSYGNSGTSSNIQQACEICFICNASFPVKVKVAPLAHCGNYNRAQMFVKRKHSLNQNDPIALFSRLWKVFFFTLISNFFVNVRIGKISLCDRSPNYLLRILAPHHICVRSFFWFNSLLPSAGQKVNSLYLFFPFCTSEVRLVVWYVKCYVA